MTSSPQADGAVIDYWREVARRGVAAVGFTVRRFAGEAWMVAELAGPRSGMVRRAALAVLEIDKTIAAETGSRAWMLRFALAQRLETAAAVRQLAAYQAALAERLQAEIQADPAMVLARLAAPHENLHLLGHA